MSALVCHGAHDCRIEQRAIPQPSAGEVLVRPLFNGICFTDKHVFDGHLARKGQWILGHEFSAEVVGAGPGAAGFAPGALVSIDPRIRCGSCLPCRAGLETLCEKAGFLGVDGADGGLATFCVVPAYCLYPLPDRVSPLQGACIEAACCATRAMRSGTVAAGDNVVLLGLEDYNLYMAQWLKGLGATVIGVDPEAKRREAARAFGADHVIDPNAGKAAAQIRALMPFGADLVSVAAEDYVPEAANYLALAYKAARIQGTVIVMRAYGGAMQAKVQPMVPWLKELTIRHFGNFFGNEPTRGGRPRGDWQVTLDALARGTIGAPPPGAQIIPFRALAEAGAVTHLFDALPGSASKIIVDMTG